MNDHDALEAVRHAALWFTPSEDGLAPLLDLIGDARLVLVGEATHGTEEFYRMRANLTQALIRGKQFNIVAVEADWPDAFRVNRWVRHLTRAARARHRYSCFEQFGTDDAQSYGYAATLGLSRSCEDRDTHMMETLDALLAWTTKQAGYARAVVWAHNSHLGDARATQMGDWGELNLGQLARVTPSLHGSWSRENSDLPETYPTGV